MHIHTFVDPARVPPSVRWVANSLKSYCLDKCPLPGCDGRTVIVSHCVASRQSALRPRRSESRQSALGPIVAMPEPDDAIPMIGFCNWLQKAQANGLLTKRKFRSPKNSGKFPLLRRRSNEYAVAADGDIRQQREHQHSIRIFDRYPHAYLQPCYGPICRSQMMRRVKPALS